MNQQQQIELVQNLEIEMMSDMYNRLTASCLKKCIPARYKEGDLTKGESVCVDRCVAKYLEVHDRIGKKLASFTQMDQAAMNGPAAVPQNVK